MATIQVKIPDAKIDKQMKAYVRKLERQIVHDKGHIETLKFQIEDMKERVERADRIIKAVVEAGNLCPPECRGEG